MELRKMDVAYENPIRYWIGKDDNKIYLNDHLGQTIYLRFDGEIFCVDCGKKIPKAYGQGFCYPCFSFK